MTFLLLCACTSLCWQAQPAPAAETGTFSGRVFDIDQTPVAGAEIYLYTSDNIRRPANFIAAATGPDGSFRIQLPTGAYWSVARLREGASRYGPLLPGDRHSGVPVEIEIAVGEEVEEDFVVVSLVEAARLTHKTSAEFFKVEGRILGAEGKPPTAGYAYAHRSRTVGAFPDYVSGWLDDQGGYTIFLPRGTFYLGGATEWPLPAESRPSTELVVDQNRPDLDIVVNN